MKEVNLDKMSVPEKITFAQQLGIKPHGMTERELNEAIEEVQELELPTLESKNIVNLKNDIESVKKSIVELWNALNKFKNESQAVKYDREIKNLQKQIKELQDAGRDS